MDIIHDYIIFGLGILCGYLIIARKYLNWKFQERVVLELKALWVLRNAELAELSQKYYPPAMESDVLDV